MKPSRSLLLLAAACLLALPRGAGADDRDFLRRGTEAPLVFILLDTSSSMALTTRCTQAQFDAGDCRQVCTAQNGNCFAPRNGDDPASKLYQAKEVLTRVLQRVTDMNFGFASFNQDDIRVVQKHWLYRAVAGTPVTLEGNVPFPVIDPANGALEVFGAAWPCATTAGLGEIACTAATAASANDPWQMTRLHRVPKPSGVAALPLYIQSGNGANLKRYEVTYDCVRDAGNVCEATDVLGAASYRVSIDVGQCVDAACAGKTPVATDMIVTYELVGQFLSHEGEVGVPDAETPTTNEEYRVFFDGSQSMVSSDILADVTAQNNSASCEGWEPNAWTAPPANPDEAVADDEVPVNVGDPYNLRFATTNLADPLGKHFFVGDVVPFDWDDDHKGTLLTRLGPGGRFDQASFFEDRDGEVGGVNNGFLDLINSSQRPLLAHGRGPLGEAIKDFRTWYAGCPQGNCNPNQGEIGWDDIAGARDPGFGCRKKYLIVISDGDEGCGGGNSACNGTAALRAQEGIETFVVAFGVPTDSHTVLNCMPANSHTKDPFLPQNMKELEDALTGIFLEIREESRAFASAAVPSVEANVRDKIYLSDFTPLTEESVWDGHLDAFVKPLPVDPASGLPIDSPSHPDYRSCASFTAGCHLWDAGDVLKLQAPTLAQAQAGTFKLGLASANDRRVLYPDKFGVLQMFQPPNGGPDWIDLFEGFGFADITDVPGTRTRATDIIENTLAIKEATIDFRDGTSQDIEFVLGDVFHSDPVVAESGRDFDDFANNLFSTGGDCELGSNSDKGYRCFAFKAQNRRKLLLMGTNDGQLHALDAGTFSVDSNNDGTIDSFSNGTGREAFAYIPRMGLPIVRDAAEGDRHIYGVDGPVTVADAWFPGDLEWHTLAVGGMREGGTKLGGTLVLVPEDGPLARPIEMGYYALDITQPDPLDEVIDPDTNDVVRFEPADTDAVPGCTTVDGLTAANCPRPFPQLLWEFTDRSGLTELLLDEDGNGTGDLAAPWSKPVLTRIRIKTGEDTDGNPITEPRFVVVVGGGVDPGAKTSPTPSAGNWIYILDAETGAVLYKRTVQGAVPSVAVLDANEDSFADTIYAGTTVGLMYKIDISTPQPLVDVNVPDIGTPVTLWPTQRITAAAWEPFAIFQAPAGQPIYMQVQVLFVARLARFALVFGTGDREDLWTFGGNQGRLYVVVDEGFSPATSGLPFTEDQYHQVTPSSAALANSSNLLLDPSGGTGSQKGWFMLLEADERVITKAFGVSGILIFSSFQPQVFIETEGQGNNAVNICTRFGKSRNFVVFAFNGNPVANLDTDLATGVTPGPGPVPPGGEGLDRFLVLDDFVTSPFVEQAHTQNVTGDGEGGGAVVPTAQTCTDDPRLGAITDILKSQGPTNARYGNYFLRLGQRMSKRGIFYPACVPIAVMQRNWREN